MHDSFVFLKAILDSIAEQIAVIDMDGNIVFVNQSWIDFGEENAVASEIAWNQINYLHVCDASSHYGDTFASNAAKGIRKIIHEEESHFYLEYPCHSPTEQRWFLMRVTPLLSFEKRYVVISHTNITERKQAEETILKLSQLDGLTKLHNYRAFNEYLTQEWKRCIRADQPITLAMIDIDYFKCVNDTYGHLIGDDYLCKLAQLIKRITKRPTDFCARYGGEEFVVLLPETSLESALHLIEGLMKSIHKAKIPNPNSSINPFVTLSIGLATIFPKHKTHPKILIEKADKHLYHAKESGRNKIIHSLE